MVDGRMDAGHGVCLVVPHGVDSLLTITVRPTLIFLLLSVCAFAYLVYALLRPDKF
jgi:K+-transporting ATPase KdpF subunit